MDDEMMMKGGVEQSANPSIERMLKVFEFALPKPGEICKHLAGAYNSNSHAVGFTILLFYAENKQKN